MDSGSVSELRVKITTRSNRCSARVDRASSREATQVRRGGWLRFNPWYSLVICSESLPSSSSMIHASYGVAMSRMSRTFLPINS